jgi:hypothetical protein
LLLGGASLPVGGPTRRQFAILHAVWCFQPHDGGRVRGLGIIHSYKVSGRY